MKHALTRIIIMLIIAAALLFGSVAAYATDTVDALYNGEPPSYPTPTATAPINAFEPMLPPTFEQPAPEEPVTTPDSEPEVAPDLLYPVDVSGVEENGTRWIIKTYELGESENPESIPRAAFERDGWRFEITDVIKKETSAADTREHIEAVSIETETKDMTEIIGQLTPTLDFADDDGYCGVLLLDISTIQVETAGTKTNSYTVSAKREYPRLSSADTSLIPKTITDNGRTLTLANVDWKAGNTVAVDYDALPEYYTAFATYTATGSKTVITGYVTTAEYKGTITKLVTGKTLYIAYFEGTQIAPPTPEPTPETVVVTDLPEEPQKSVNLFPIALCVGIALLCGLAYLLFLRRNVKVVVLKNGKALPIGKTRVALSSTVIDLTKFEGKTSGDSFILVLDRLAAKRLFGKTVTVRYGDRTFQHIVCGDGGKYRFEVDF
ncbi:MAG: hypothetical protein LBN43_08890 [Oscillospiraceae bacterium]|nr:hypothetical protein [Oscillospiraceae bacterium]